MIHAYGEIYLEPAQTVLASMLDHGVNGFGFDIDEMLSLFIASGFAERFSRGDARLVVGMSGYELARSVLEEIGLSSSVKPPMIAIGRSPVYWTGWVLAYYQWWSALDFDEIIGHIPANTLLRLYHPYHEMDIISIRDKLDGICRKDTRLKSRRLRFGLSQSQLAKASGVPVRTIQQYEQRAKSIDKAQANTVAALAAALGTSSEKLLENGFSGRT